MTYQLNEHLRHCTFSLLPENCSMALHRLTHMLQSSEKCIKAKIVNQTAATLETTSIQVLQTEVLTYIFIHVLSSAV